MGIREPPLAHTSVPTVSPKSAALPVVEIVTYSILFPGLALVPPRWIIDLIGEEVAAGAADPVPAVKLPKSIASPNVDMVT